MDPNLKYIESNFKEFEEIINMMAISAEQLNELIKRKLVPEPSYVINSKIQITSSLNDSYEIAVEKKYFHPAVLVLIENHLEKNSAEIFKKTFKENLLFNLKKHPQKEFAYGNVFDENNIIDNEKIEKALEEEWNHFCKGVYGICTLNNNEGAIINKEIAIKRILNFIEKKSNSTTENELEELKELNKKFNESTSLFAPYQRESSSRGKYLDKLLREFSLDEFVKKL